MFVEYLGTLSLLLGIVTGMWGLYQIIKGLKGGKLKYSGIIFAVVAIALLLAPFALNQSSANGAVFNQSTPGTAQSQPNISATDLYSTPTPTLAPSPTPTPTLMPTPPSQYPRLASDYKGIIHNTSANYSGTLEFNFIVQNQQTVSGGVVIGGGLLGSGSFTGTISTDGAITFTDTPTDGGTTIIFKGILHADGSLDGTYTSPGRNDGDGTWETMPSS